MNSLRKTMAALAMALCAGLTANAQAGDTDACSVTLCMFGKLTGNSGGSECKSAEKKFFSIQVKKKGKFKPDATQDARRQFVNQCPAGDGWGDKIADKYGKVRL